MTLPSPSPTSPLAPNARLRYDVVRRLLADLDDAASFLEVGCGQGAVAAQLAHRFDYLGYEPDADSFRVAHERLTAAGAGRVVNGALPETPERLFDLIGAFEVLEHIEHDERALESWTAWLRPGGHLIVSVPADPERFGAWDREVGHYRRYTRTSLNELLGAAGLIDVELVSYGFPLGYALERVRNRMASRREEAEDDLAERTAASGRRLQPGNKLAPFIWVATLPFIWLQRPFADGALGTGLVARAQKPG